MNGDDKMSNIKDSEMLTKCVTIDGTPKVLFTKRSQGEAIDIYFFELNNSHASQEQSGLSIEKTDNDTSKIVDGVYLAEKSVKTLPNDTNYDKPSYHLDAGEGLTITGRATQDFVVVIYYKTKIR